MADLITSDYATEILAAAGVALNSAQNAVLASLISTASENVRAVCSRYFNRKTWVKEVYPEGRPVMLPQFPINSLVRVAGNRTSALAISADRNTNQRATVGFSSTGDEATGLTFTGLALSRVSYAVTTNNSLLFSSYPTIAQLAAAVNGLGGGWTARVLGSLDAWSSADLVGGDVSMGAIAHAAEFQVYLEDLSSVRIMNRRTGEIWIPTFYGPIQVTYDAGFDVIPLPVQEATAEVVKAMFDRLPNDSTLSGETLKSYQWTAADTQSAIPPYAWSSLMRFKSWGV